jgi:hypothetical protein
VGISDQRSIFKCKKNEENSPKGLHQSPKSAFTGIRNYYVLKRGANTNLPGEFLVRE